MIKINLLGEDTAIDQSGRLLVLGYGASIAAMVLVFFLMSGSIASHISEMQSDIEGLETTLAQLKNKTQEVRELEKKKADLDQITATIAKLKLSQEGPVRVLDDLNKALPAKAWLTKVEEREGLMTLVGYAVTDHDIAAFMKNLELSNYFEGVDLIESVSVALIKVNAYNHFTSKYTRYTVRAEEKLLQFRKIQEEARSLGLKYQATDGPPVKGSSQAGTVTVMATDSLKDGGKAGGVKSGVFRQGSARTEKVSAWASVEPSPAKAFAIRARVVYSGRLKALEEEAAKGDKTDKNEPDKNKKVDSALIFWRPKYASIG